MAFMSHTYSTTVRLEFSSGPFNYSLNLVGPESHRVWQKACFQHFVRFILSVKTFSPIFFPTGRSLLLNCLTLNGCDAISSQTLHAVSQKENCRALPRAWEWILRLLHSTEPRIKEMQCRTVEVKRMHKILTGDELRMWPCSKVRLC